MHADQSAAKLDRPSPAIPAPPTAQYPPTAVAASWPCAVATHLETSYCRRDRPCRNRLRSRRGQLRRAHMAHALACLLAQKRQPSACSATKAALVRCAALPPTVARQRRNLSRLARTPRDTAPDSRDRETLSSPGFCASAACPAIPRQKLAVMLHLRRRAILLPVFLNGPHAMRADRNDLLHLDSAPAPQGSPPPVAETPDRCPAAAPDRLCIFLCAARRSSRPGNRITRTNASIISRPLGSYPPMQPSHKQYSCVPSKIGSAFFSTNLSRSVALSPSALLPRSSARKSLLRDCPPTRRYSPRRAAAQR